MTWLILLFHTNWMFQPGSTSFVVHPDTSPQYDPRFLPILSSLFQSFMNAWNMPLFFFLAGISAYLSLQRYVDEFNFECNMIVRFENNPNSINYFKRNKGNYFIFRRSVEEYKLERVHRLVVPTLFVFICALPFAIEYFAPMNSACLQHFYGNATNSTPPCRTWLGIFERMKNLPEPLTNHSSLPISFLDLVIQRYRFPFPAQAWFCMYLFIYSKIFAFSFNNWHSKHGDEGPDQVTCCRRQMKPFSLTTRIFCCLTNCGISAMSPKEFSQSINGLLMHPVKLACIPAILISITEIALRYVLGDMRGAVPLDWANHCNYIVVYILGYAVMSEDKNGFGEMLRKCRWWYFGIGVIILSAFASVEVFGNEWFAPFYVHMLKSVLRGFGEWIFILGLYSANRSICTTSFPIIKTLREMAMPFYLTHMQILVVLASGIFWIPYLGTFLPTLIISTLITSAVSFLITKSPDPIRYLFGLPSVTSRFPGKKLKGFVPLLVLFSCEVVLCTSANMYYYLTKSTIPLF